MLARVVLLAQLIGLLTAFIGENLTGAWYARSGQNCASTILMLEREPKMKKQNNAVKRKLKKIQSPRAKVTIHKMPTGVRGLDEILGGGIPEFSFNVIAGTPGCGKTTLAHQIVFANATPKKPALYFTVLGEPAMKMLRHQQQFSFFDASKVGHAIRFINLADLLEEGNVNAVFEEIVKQVTAADPGIVVVDSFRSMERKDRRRERFGDALLRPAPGAVSDHWQATTFLVGEYVEGEMRDNPLFTVADGLFLAVAGDGAKFRGAKIAGHEAARAGLGAGIAHHPDWR